MWGEIAGTGLAGGGTGAVGKHGDTSQGAGDHGVILPHPPRDSG